MRSRSVGMLLLFVLFPVIVPNVFADVPVEVKALEDAFARACQAGDVEGVLALYADDASVIWPGEGEEAKGKTGMTKMVTALCRDTKNLKLTVKSLEARSLGNDHIGVVGHWEIASTGADGKPSVIQMRATEVLRRSGGKLLYLIDHGSVGMPASPPGGAAGAAPAAKQY